MTLSLRKAILAGALASAPALLVAEPLAAQAVVQAVPPAALSDLNSALRDLGRSPRSVPILLRAAWASVELDDIDAALGFFRRAEAVDPGNGEIKAGLATIELRQGDPVAAMRLFAEAEAAGIAMARFAADRGLAHDLVGDNQVAQRHYRQALALKDDPEVTRRLAISQAMSGDQRASEATLLPLLQRSDLAAYRARAFALAIMGKSEEAVSIAQTMLPGSLSNRMAPYLRYMPRLTRAQQAAAANLGRFPPADQIGRDSPAVAALSAQAAPVQVAARTPDARLEPAGQPLGSSRAAAAAAATTERRAPRQPQPRAQQQQTAPGIQPAPSSPWVSREEAAAIAGRARVDASAPPEPQRVAAPPAAEPRLTPVAVASPAMVRVFEAPPQAQANGASQAELPPQAGPAQQPAASFSLPPSQVASEPQVAPPVQVAALQDATPGVTEMVPEPSQAPRPSLSIASPAAPDPAPGQQDLADAFADFSRPVAAAPATGAVDISKIEVRREKPPAKEEPKEAEKPKPPAHPSRVWVQVATGRDVKALGFDWRRIQREAGPLLARRNPHTAKWGQTNRLVAGPYASAAEAQKAVADLKKKGIDSFTFTSDEGEAVAPLG